MSCSEPTEGDVLDQGPCCLSLWLPPAHLRLDGARLVADRVCHAQPPRHRMMPACVATEALVRAQ